MKMKLGWLVLLLCFFTALDRARAQTAPGGRKAADGRAPPQIKPAPPPEAVDLKHQPTLYVVGYAHLDTEWRWEYPQTIREYIRKTMLDNFALIDKYPHYVFNFSGANRYRFMK